MARIQQSILLLRKERVMLDSDLAELYGVETKALTERSEEIWIVSLTILCSS